MSLPPLNQALEEVQPENLIKDNEYLIETNSYDGANIKHKGKFIGREGDGDFVLSIFKLHYLGNMIVPFLNRRTRYYRPRAQELLNNQAQTQYRTESAAKMIDEKTGTSIGESMIGKYNIFPEPSGGKKKQSRKRKQTTHKKRKGKGKKSRRMK